MTVQDEARRRMVAFRDDLVSQGWTLVRDNEEGGALVIEHEGIRLVVSIHGYEVKETAADLIKEYEAEHGEITEEEIKALDGDAEAPA